MPLTVAAAFTQSNGDSPATGLTLAEIDLYLTSQNKTTGATAVVWNGTQNPTAEIDNAGAYARIYSSEDLDTFNYFVRAQYTGAATLDQDTVQGSVGAEHTENLGDGWDEILTGATHNITNSSGKILRLIREGGFEGASVWIDTVNGTPGGEGTVTDPVDDITAALVVATTLGYRRVEYVTGSSDTLVAPVDGYCIHGFGYTLALGGQSISGTRIHNATLSGICTGASPPEFRKCAFGNTTVPSCTIRASSFSAALILSGTGNYFLDKCFSAVAGTSAPSFDFGGAVAGTNLNMRHYSGGAEILNMGVLGTDNMSLEGFGQLILNANCAGGTIAIRGHFTITDNAGGVVTLSDNARYDIDQVFDRIMQNAETYEQYMNDIRAVIAGASTGDDATDPTSVVYKQPDGATTQITHGLVGLDRTES